MRIAAAHQVYYPTEGTGTTWHHNDPNSKSYRSTMSNGAVLGDGSWNVDWDKIETDPDGKSTGFSAPVYYPLDSNDLYTSGWSFGSMVNGKYTLNVVDGIHVPQDYMWDVRLGNRHGSLGLDLLEFSALMSRRVTIFDPTGVRPLGTFDRGNVPDHLIPTTQNELIARWSDWNWSAINLIAPPPQDEFKFTLWYSKDSEHGKGLAERIKAVVLDPKALSDECTKAFQDVGATPIKDQLAQHNLTFVTESVFMNPRSDGFWSPDQEFAGAIRSKAGDHIRRYLRIGPTITGEIEVGDITFQENGGVYNGLRYIGITNYGTKEKIEHFSVTLIHALVHSGGVKGKDGVGTDLHYLGDKYDAIIDACQKNKPRVKRAGGN